jgi:hypothetical protein
MSRKHKAKHRLEQSRKEGTLKAELRLAEAEAALLIRERAIVAQQYEDGMIAMYRDADATQRDELERVYKEATKNSLRTVHEAHIIASLQSQPRGVCDLSQAK